MMTDNKNTVALIPGIQKAVLILFTVVAIGVTAQNPNVLPESDYPYWPSYQYLEIEDLDTIQAQKWINEDHVIEGWDWSLPGFVEPSPRSWSACRE
jgi:hypothetical protein